MTNLERLRRRNAELLEERAKAAKQDGILNKCYKIAFHLGDHDIDRPGERTYIYKEGQMHIEVNVTGNTRVTWDKTHSYCDISLQNLVEKVTAHYKGDMIFKGERTVKNRKCEKPTVSYYLPGRGTEAIEEAYSIAEERFCNMPPKPRVKKPESLTSEEKHEKYKKKLRELFREHSTLIEKL